MDIDWDTMRDFANTISLEKDNMSDEVSTLVMELWLTAAHLQLDNEVLEAKLNGFWPKGNE